MKRFVLVLKIVCGLGSATLPTSVVLAAPPGSWPCASTPEGAVASVLAHRLSAGDPHGFRVAVIRMDVVHRSAWAMVASCSEPSRPMVALHMAWSADARAAAQLEKPLVHAGEHVLAIGRSKASSMRLNGVAMENGRAGQRIRVRLDASLFGERSAGAEVFGLVASDGVVEVTR